jgi:hypothetical protein
VISLAGFVKIVMLLIGVALIIGIFWWAINYCAKEYPSPIWGVVRVIFVLLVALLAIGLILSFLTGSALFAP